MQPWFDGPRRAAPRTQAGLHATLRRLPIAFAVSIGGWLAIDLLDTDSGLRGDYDNLFMLGFLSVVMLPWLLSPAIDERRRWMRGAVAATREADDTKPAE